MYKIFKKVAHFKKETFAFEGSWSIYFNNVFLYKFITKTVSFLSMCHTCRYKIFI